MRYLKDATTLYRKAGAEGFAKLAEGQALRYSGERQGDYVKVQPVDENGRASGEAGWVSAGGLKKKPAYGGRVAAALKRGGRTYLLDRVGHNILTSAPCRSGYCAATYEAAGGASGGHAYQYVKSLASNPNFRRLGRGDVLQPGDVVVWRHYGSNAGTRGWKYGHIGVVGVDAETGAPFLVSNFEGRRDIRPINDNGHMYVYRPGG